MKLLRLGLTDFKCFQDVLFSIDKPLMILYGPNGSGKSTILEAIRLALGSVSPTLSRGEKLVRHLNTTLASGEAKIRLEVAFTSKEWTDILTLTEGSKDFTTKQIDFLSNELSECPVTFLWSHLSREGQEATTTRSLKFSDSSSINAIDSQQLELAEQALHTLSSQDLGRVLGTLYLPIWDWSDFEEFVPFNQVLSEPKREKYIRNWLLHLSQNRPKEYSKLVSKLYELFPDTKEFRIKQNRKTGEIELFIEKLGGTAFEPAHRRALMFLPLLLVDTFPDFFPLVLLDAVDATLERSLVKEFYKIIKRIQKKTQVISTTHSNDCLDYISTSYSLMRIKMTDGSSRTIEPISNDKLRGIIDEQQRVRLAIVRDSVPRREEQVTRAELAARILEHIYDANTLMQNKGAPDFFLKELRIVHEMHTPCTSRDDFVRKIQTLALLFELTSLKAWRNEVKDFDKRWKSLGLFSEWLRQQGEEKPEKIISTWREIVSLRSKIGPPIHPKTSKEAFEILRKLGAKLPIADWDSIWLKILEKLKDSLFNLVRILDILSQ